MATGLLAKIQEILTYKADIKTAIETKLGYSINNSLSGWANSINNINTNISSGSGTYDDIAAEAKGYWLTPQTTVITKSDGTTASVATNPNITIVDEDYKEWTVQSWNNRWIDNGYSKIGLSKPIGIGYKCAGLHYCLLWQLTGENLWDVSGTKQLCSASSTGFLSIQHSPYNHSQITGNSSGTDSLTGKSYTTTLNSETNVIDFYTANTKMHFYGYGNCGQTDQNTGKWGACRTTNFDERTVHIYNWVEWLRHRFAIDSGLTTTEADGTYGTITILDADGNQPAVNEDMYFYINDTKTEKLAKYNITGTLTSAISDSIYAAQKSAGINMNDTGFNSATKPILCKGAKGAEAIAVDGKWYIITPYITNPNSTFSADANIQDAPAIYRIMYEHNNTSDKIYMSNERMLYGYWLNRDTMIAGIINYLNNIEGNTVPPLNSGSSVWSVVRTYSNSAWLVYMSSGSITSYYTYYRYGVIPAAALS